MSILFNTNSSKNSVPSNIQHILCLISSDKFYKDTELTLKLNEAVIEKAKEYASLHKTSLSMIIENYLQKIIKEDTEQEQITPLVKSLPGIIDLAKDFDHKEAYATFIVNKYK